MGNNRYLGPSTCASVGCHGFSGRSTAGAKSSATGSDSSENESAWRTAYWKWKSDDPHAQAYDVLWRPRSPDSLNSMDIVRQLDPQAVASNKLYAEFLLKNCCGCHATGVASAEAGAGDRPPESLELGVHCEACHGPARDWLKEHTLNAWTLRPQVEQEAAGHRATRDLTVRASICVECHVGSKDARGQEVNHDLIAAGHPRLAFEFTVYLSRLPPHWDDARDRKWAERPSPSQQLTGRARSNFELEAWNAGQLVSARQALRLLAGRAQKVADGDDQPWPEFSEYDCFACHHELNATGYRQKGKSDGNWSCANWYTALSDHWLPPTGGTRDSLAQLQSLLERQSPPPQPQDVAKTADELCGQLAAILASRPVVATPKGRAQLVKALASGKQPETGWIEASQWILAVTACVKAYDPDQIKAHAADLEGHLEGLQDRLAFSPGPADENGGRRRRPRGDAERSTARELSTRRILVIEKSSTRSAKI